MEKEYELFGKNILLPENPSFDTHVSNLNELFQTYTKYLKDEGEVLKTMAYNLVCRRHYIGANGDVSYCTITALGIEHTFNASEKELAYYKESAKEVDRLFMEYAPQEEDEKKVLPFFLLSLADNFEIDTINYNIERANDFIESPSGKMAMFKYLDEALDAMEIWAQRGFDEKEPRPCFGPYRDYHRQEQVITTLNRLYDAIRLAPQRLASDKRYREIDLRIARFGYILTSAPVGFYNYSQDSLCLRDAVFCSNFEQYRLQRYLVEFDTICENIHDKRFATGIKQRLDYLLSGAGNLANTGSDVTRSTVAKYLLDLAFKLEDTERYDYARKAFHKLTAVLMRSNRWMSNQVELQGIASIGYKAMCECCRK